MSTSIVILSPLSEARTLKAVAQCLGRAAKLEVLPPSLHVVAEVPDLAEVTAMIDEEDQELLEKLSTVESLIEIEHPSTLSKDPVFVECVRFLLRRVGDAVVQFPEGVADVEIAEMLIASLEGVENFDEREATRHLQVRLMDIKYRLLTNLWQKGSSKWKPHALSNTDIEQFEKSGRFNFPPEFRGYLAIVGVGPGPGAVGIVPLDDFEKPKTYAKTAKRPRLGKTVVVGSVNSEHKYILVSEGDFAGTVWEVQGGELSDGPVAPGFLEYIENWIGLGEPESLLCESCGVVLEVKDLEREFCQGCGARRAAAEERSEADQAFEALAKGLLFELLETELLEIEDPTMLPPLVAALSEYMSEKGHKWRSPDKAAASIAGWLMHRDEVAELHGSNSDVARVFAKVAAG